MKYKNYRNPKTNEDRIYSHKNMMDMSLREIKDREEELLSQVRILGIPKDEELSGSENVVWVDDYTKDDGTKVSGYWRSKHDSGSSDNNDVKNDNNETDNAENTEINAQDSEKYDDKNLEYYSEESIEYIPESEEYKKEYKEKEKQKSIERKDPDEIAGVKRGEPMTFEEMVQKGVNPNYNGDDDSGYAKNCQSCNVACELIIRGYDVEAESYDNPVMEELAKNENSAYFDPITNEKCIPQEIDLSKGDCYESLDAAIKAGERYEFAYHLTPENGEYLNTNSHTVFISRTHNNELTIYDGQNGEIFYGNMQVKKYISAQVNDNNTIYYPRILRVDDKRVNPYYTDKVVRKSGKD